MTPEQKIEAVASVLSHFFLDLTAVARALEPLFERVDDREIFRSALKLAQARRELAERGLYLPDYSLRVRA